MMLRNLLKRNSNSYLGRLASGWSWRWRRRTFCSEPQRDSIQYDVVIVGAGPAGLSAAIRLKQLCRENDTDLSVCVVEKGAELGAHILSGNVFEPRALDELLPNWKQEESPITVPVSSDKFWFLTKNHAFPLPCPFNNRGNYVISLSQLVRWMGVKAEELGVEIYPGFAASEILYDSNDTVVGIRTNDMGISKDGSKKENFQPGIELKGRVTLLAEGCRGSLSENVMDKYNLRVKGHAQHQTYALGIKEVWEIDKEKHKPGAVIHTLGWPLDQKTYGGSFLYHMKDRQICIGLVVALNYQNPFLSPYEEFQKFKHHPAVKPLLEGGTVLQYGARTLNEGGFQTRLQAQAAGVPYSHPLSNITSRMAFFGPTTLFADLRCLPSCTRAGIHGIVSICPPDCFQYKGTLDVFGKIIRQEGFARLWRGTNAGLALAVPTVGIYLPCYDIFRNWLEEFTARHAPSTTVYVPLVAGSLARSLACATCYPIELARTRMQAFKVMQNGAKPPGVLKTLLNVVSQVKTTSNNAESNLRGYRVLWTGMGAQLARDVPYSAICWATLEPIRRRLLNIVGDEANAVSIFGANFSAGFVAGTIAAAATCPLDVAKTRRQIENDPVRQLKMTTRQTLMEIWRSGGLKGLFTGVGPRVGRAGPSVGIVVSFYEVVKYALHQRHATS